MHDEVPAVAVVMSAYNGARYIEEQIESILAQEGVSVALYVRDDGSTDGTVELLRAFERKGLLTLITGQNLGVVGSFIAGLAAVPATFSYIALSDQDDVWKPWKLKRAISLLAKHDQAIPQLYCSEYVFCDEQMRPLKCSHLNVIGVRFETLLYETKVSGNTIVMNRALADCAVAAGAQDVYCHDWWLGLIAAGLGELVFDDECTLDYRRIASSVSPTGASPLALLRYRIKTFLNREELGKITAQLRRYDQLFGADLSDKKRALLERFVQGGRLAKAFAPVRLRQSIIEECALRVLFLGGML